MNKFMKVAIELSESNIDTDFGGPFGACVVKDGEIIGKGANSVIKDNDPTAHAEIVAIREACKNIKSFDLSGCELYTTCYPCPMCISAIIWANINKVYYGNTKEDAENIGFRDDDIYDFIRGLSNDISLELECMDRDETIKAFNDYAAEEKKAIY